jgi:hypothetical protein
VYEKEREIERKKEREIKRQQFGEKFHKIPESPSSEIYN